ncbi:Uncharacterised protein [Segatella copri]|nr:Uncharacterised protein [Segatella copri]
MYMSIKLFRNKRLLHIVVGPGGITCLQVFRRGESGGKQNYGFSVNLAYFLHHFYSVHDGHVDIRYDNIGLKVLPHFQSFLAVYGSFHLISSDDIFEATFLHIGEVFIILYQEQFSICHNLFSF